MAALIKKIVSKASVLEKMFIPSVDGVQSQGWGSVVYMMAPNRSDPVVPVDGIL